MNTSLEYVLRRYLGRQIPLHGVREWLTLHEPELSAHEEDLADEADVALVHFYDGYSDEDEVRYRLSWALERQTIQSNPFVLFLTPVTVPYPLHQSRGTEAETNHVLIAIW